MSYDSSFVLFSTKIAFIYLLQLKVTDAEADPSRIWDSLSENPDFADTVEHSVFVIIASNPQNIYIELLGDKVSALSKRNWLSWVCHVVPGYWGAIAKWSTEID